MADAAESDGKVSNVAAEHTYSIEKRKRRRQKFSVDVLQYASRLLHTVRVVFASAGQRHASLAVRVLHLLRAF